MPEGIEENKDSGRPSRAKIWWSAAVVAVLAAAGGVVALAWPDDPPPPEYTIRQIAGFPEYATGTRVVAADASELPLKMLHFSFVPKSRDTKIIARCDLDSTKFVRLAITVNGRDRLSIDCEAPQQRDTMLSPDRYELVVDQEVQIIAELTGYGVPGSRGSFGVAAVEPVPSEQYPYPPRPADLVDLRAQPPGSDVQVRSGGPTQATITWKQSVTFHPRINTPGKLRVLLDGKPADECESWDYQARTCPTAKIDGLPMWRQHQFVTGQQVTVTVIAERTTGDWEVGVRMY
jgi:hypothetical protein